jgi:hypothetical protein
MTISGQQTFLFFKWAIYLLLSYNVYLFGMEELAASSHTFADGVTPATLIEGFSATIDTAAWVILLLLFELETEVLPDERIVGWVKWVLHGARSFCYLFIGYAFYGYCVKLQLVYGVVPLPAELCSLVGQGWSLMIDLDEYELLDATNCIRPNAGLLQLTGLPIAVTENDLNLVQRLAWVDVFNAADWILIVLILEFDVLMQLRGRLTNQMMATSKWIKGFLYSVLLAAAVYWGFAGDFLDFWDAVLWLIAFIFIELNVFQWQAETQEDVAPADA